MKITIPVNWLRFFKDLYSDSKRLTKYSHNSRSLYLKHFEADRLYKNMFEHLHEVVSTSKERKICKN